MSNPLGDLMERNLREVFAPRGGHRETMFRYTAPGGCEPFDDDVPLESVRAALEH